MQGVRFARLLEIAGETCGSAVYWNKRTVAVPIRELMLRGEDRRTKERPRKRSPTLVRFCLPSLFGRLRLGEVAGSPGVTLFFLVVRSFLIEGA
jgi:hypothetical protein